MRYRVALLSMSRSRDARTCRGRSMAEPAGHPRLRAAIAHHVYVSRNVCATSEDVLVTNGSQQAMDLAARVLLEPRARVAVEEPGYTTPRLLFASLGAGVPVDREGLVVDALFITHGIEEAVYLGQRVAKMTS